MFRNKNIYKVKTFMIFSVLERNESKMMYAGNRDPDLMMSGSL